MNKKILEMKQITKAFNHITVLNQVDFSLEHGEIHALMGGNGAGKSTLMKILTGVYHADEGSITIDGEKASISSVHDSQSYGVSMIFQEFSLIPTLTVAQNIFLTREPQKMGLINDRECIRATRQLLDEVGIHDINPNTVVNELGVGYWQLTEIAKALSQNTKILIMDEPTSSLTRSETEMLFKLMKRLKEKGISIIYISHRMEEIFEICDRITILRDGQGVFTTKIIETDMVEVIEHMIGNSNTENSFVWKSRKVNRNMEPIMELDHIHSGKRVHGVSLKLYPGEVLGIAGLMGSGRTELFQTIFGIQEMEKGEIRVNGKKIKIKSPGDAMNQGLAMIPEDRRKKGLILEHTVKENTLLPTLRKLVEMWLINDKKGEQLVSEYIDRLNIKTDNMNKMIRLLSGGNQQKVVLAKWLLDSPSILLLDEPTIGVDIGAKLEIVDIIRKLADEGKAIMVISSELTELLAVSDRIIILKEGKVQKEIERVEIDSEEVLHHAIQ